MVNIELVRSFRTKRSVNIDYYKKFKQFPCGAGLGLHPDARYLIIRLPQFSKLMKLLARCMLLALLVVSFPWMGSTFLPFSEGSDHFDRALNIVSDHHHQYLINVQALPLLFRDLANEGLLQTRQGKKAVFMSSAAAKTKDEDDVISRLLNDNEMEIVSTKDSERQSSIPDVSFSFAFVPNFPAAAKFIDRTLKLNGVVSFQLSFDRTLEKTPSFHKPQNYKIVYLRRFGENHQSTFVAMRKTGNDVVTGKRRLFGYNAEDQAKKAALENLEAVLLEPPRAASRKSRRYLKRTKYLPDLMGDSLEGYSRRVFIDVGGKGSSGGDSGAWFSKNYPTRNKDFEVYKVETTEEAAEEVGMMSEWLERNVREEEYVVMKAEAEAVEELVRSKAIRLVDELFLECKPDHKGGTVRRRAYWECLALYGRLRDEGVAVHQWWG